MRRLLILFAHPALQKSRIHRRLIPAVRDLHGVTFHDLYEAYPDFDINVPAEQARLSDHDVIIFQHPFYWYSTPALIKEWQDLVLEYGYAYGPGGTTLTGKIMLNAISAGGAADAYQRDGYNHFTVRELLAPLEQTARLCGMHYLPPFVIHGTVRLTDPAAIDAQAESYRRLLLGLRDETFDLAAVADLPRLNEDLNALGL